MSVIPQPTDYPFSLSLRMGSQVAVKNYYIIALRRFLFDHRLLDETQLSSPIFDLDLRKAVLRYQAFDTVSARRNGMFGEGTWRNMPEQHRARFHSYLAEERRRYERRLVSQVELLGQLKKVELGEVTPRLVTPWVTNATVHFEIAGAGVFVSVVNDTWNTILKVRYDDLEFSTQDLVRELGRYRPESSAIFKTHFWKCAVDQHVWELQKEFSNTDKGDGSKRFCCKVCFVWGWTTRNVNLLQHIQIYDGPVYEPKENWRRKQWKDDWSKVGHGSSPNIDPIGE